MYEGIYLIYMTFSHVCCILLFDTATLVRKNLIIYKDNNLLLIAFVDICSVSGSQHSCAREF